MISWASFKCPIIFTFVLNTSSHLSHLFSTFSLSIPCTIICLFIVPFCDIIIGQKGHWYFPTPSFMGSFCKKSRKNFYLPNECVYFQNIMLCAFFICERRFEFLLEEYWQNWQENGFSPVCIMICLLMPCVFFIILGQNGHPYCPAPSFMGSFCKKK